MERDRFPPGVPCWVDVTLPDPPAAATFYAGIFGWELADGMPAGAPGHYFIARLDGPRGGRRRLAPGSWNWSNLNTPDPDGATAFYGAVFGCEAASVTVGALTATMCASRLRRLPRAVRLRPAPAPRRAR